MADGSIKLGLDITTDANQIKSEATKVGDIVDSTMSNRITKGANAAGNALKKLTLSYLKLTVPDFDTTKAQANMEKMESTAQRVAGAVASSFGTALSGVINFSNDAGGRLNAFATNALGRVITFCNDAGAKLAEFSSKSGFVSIFERLVGLKMESPVPQDATSALDTMASSALRLNNVYQDMLGTQDSIRDMFSKEMVSQEDLASLGNLVTSIEEVKGQIESLQKLLDKAPAHNKLVAQFAALSDAEKASPMGQQMQAQIEAFDKSVDILKSKMDATFGTGRGSQYTAIGSSWSDNTVNELKSVLANLQQAKGDLEQEIYDNAQSKFGDFSVMVAHLRQAKSELSAMDSGKVAFTDEDYTAKAAEVQILTRAVQGLRASMQENINNKVAQDIASLEAKATELEAKRASLGTGADKSELQAIDSQLASVNEKLQLLRGAKAEPIVDMTVTNQELADAIAKVDELSERVKLARAQGANESMAGFNNLVKELDTATQKMDELKSAGEPPKQSFKDLTSMASQFAGVMQKGVNKINSGLHKLASLAGKAASSLMQLAKSTTVSSNEMKRGFKRGLKYLLMMVFGVRGLMFAFRKLRTVVISTIQEMAKSSDEFNAQISEFKTLLNTLKGSLGTMAQPLISAVLPAVNAIIQALTQAIVLAAKFFAVLSGQNYILKATGAQVDYAKSLKGTGSAAKEAQKSLMGFDELNRLNGDNNGGGGGGGAPDFTYEKEGIDQEDAVSRFAEMVKRAWQNADFFDVGRFLAQKAKGWLETFNGWLLTTGNSYAQRIARSFATLINGIVSPDIRLAQTIGETFANLGNTILSAINTFLTTTHWDEVGMFIGNAVMSGIMHFNWSLLGETLANYIRAGIMTWRGFLDSDFDFSALGTRIGEAINGFFDTMGAVDPNTGRNMWQTLGQNISDSAIGLLDMIISALDEIDWEQVGTAIGEFLGSIDWKKIFSKLKTVVIKVLGGLLTALKGWFKADKSSFITVGLIAGVMAFVGVLSTLANAIVALLPVIGWLITNFSKVAGVLKVLLPAFLPIIQVIGSLMLIIGGAITAIANFVSMWKNGVTVIKSLLMILGIALVAIGAIILGAPALVTAVIAAIVAAVAWIVLMIKQYGADVVEWLVDKVADLIEWLVNTATLIGTKISEFLAMAKDIIVTGFTTIVDWITAGCEVFANWWNSFLQGVKDVCTFIITAIVTWVQAKLEAAKVMIQTGLNLIKTVVTGIVTGVKTFISSAVSWVQNKIHAGITAVTGFFSGMRDTLVGIWNGLGNALRNTMNTILSAIGSFVNGGIGMVNGLIGAFNSFELDIPDALADAITEITGGRIDLSSGTISFPDLPTIPNVSIPQLAKGAVLPPNKPFAAIVGDQKQGTNVEAPLETIKLAVAEEMSEVKNAVVAGFEALIRTVEEKDLDVNIGDKEIGQAANRYNKKQAIMRGTV